MQPAPLTVHVVLHIALHVLAIAIAFSVFIALDTLNFMADMLIETLDKLFPNFPPIKRDMGHPAEEQKQIPYGNDKQEEQTTARTECGDSSLRSE
jgi:hypothetical protein